MAHEPSAVHHVMDSPTWEFFDRLFGVPVELHLPNLFGFQVTKFMLLELIAAALVVLIYLPLAKRIASGQLPRGRWWNAFESLLTFVRNEIVRPNLGGDKAKHAHHGDHEHGHAHEAGHGPAKQVTDDHAHHAEPHGQEVPGDPSDRFLPFFWTLFLFILFCNLLGMLPFMGSPTASISVTGALAIVAFCMMHGPAVYAKGPWEYLKSLWPHIEVPVLGPIFSAMIFIIELLGTAIKAFVLAVRLFANMFAGHMVLATILLFIYTVGKVGFTPIWPVVTVFSVGGVIALSLLELFVAFLQAYVFTFLTALFMGMALYPEH